MEEIQNKIIIYISDKSILTNINSVTQINTGADGSRICAIACDDGRFVVKTAHPSYTRTELYKLCEKELAFYNLKTRVPFAPEVIYSENNADFGIIIILKYYRPIRYDEWNEDVQLKAVDLCARLHLLGINAFNELELSFDDM